MDKRIEKAIKIFNSMPNSSMSFKLLSILLHCDTWDTGLSKDELARIFYKKKLAHGITIMVNARSGISSGLSRMRKEYDAIIYSTLGYDEIYHRSIYRLHWLSTQADVDQVIDMFEKIIENLEQAKNKVENYELSESIEIQKQLDDTLVNEYKDKLEQLKKKRKKKVITT